MGVPALGGTADDEIDPTGGYAIVSPIDNGGKDTTLPTGLTGPAKATMIGGASAATTGKDSALSIEDFNIFRQKVAAAINSVQNKIDQLLNVTDVDCSSCN